MNQDNDSSGSEEPNTTIPITSNRNLPKKREDIETSFTDFYLRQATKEFANDLDKLRSAGDFHGERSVAMLVRGLKAGTGCFGEGEMGRVVDGER